MIQAYVTDLAVYVFRPFTRIPKTEKFNVCIFSHQLNRSYKILVLAQNPQVFESLRQAKTWHDQVMEIVQHTSDHIRKSYVKFVLKASEELKQMKINRRKNPTGSKLQHLLHLENCVQLARSTCNTNIRTAIRLEAYLSRVFVGTVADKHQHRLESIKDFSKDLKYFRTKLNTLASDTRTIRETTKDQLELKQHRWTTVLAIFAGLYIPMSFVSSFFGMNINQLDAETSSWTNQTYIDPNNQNRTLGVNITRTATRGGNQAFDLRTYWAVSVPLTFGTFLFPLLLGVFLRWFLQMVSKGRLWWRAITATLGLGYVLPSYFSWSFALPGFFLPSFSMIKFPKREFQ
ncbi:hypothetical protein IWZ00DRAFT_111772 [Phyllosticta capitalensis]